MGVEVQRFMRLVQGLTEPSPELSAPARRQARTLAGALLLLTASAALAIGLQMQFVPGSAGGLGLVPELFALATAYVVSRTRYLSAALGLTFVSGYVLCVHAVLIDPYRPALLGYLCMLPVLAATLLGLRGVWAVSGISTGLVVALGVANRRQLGPQDAIGMVVLVVLVCVVVLVLVHHRQIMEHARRVELEQRQEWFKGLLDASFHGVAVVEEGRITEANPGFAAMFGVPLGGIVGRPLHDMIPGALRSGECDGFRRDGSVFPVEVVVRRWSTHTGRGDVLAVQDLSERLELQARLHQTDRMASMGQLAAGVAHEINNPLTWVIGNLDMLIDGLHGQRLGEVASRAAEGAYRIQRIVADLQTFSRVRPAERASVDLIRVLRSSVNMARHEVVHRASLLTDYAEVPPVDGDETRLGQVFLNLLVNAAQALPEGRRDDHRVAVSAFEDARGHAIVEITDSGPGIPKTVQKRMFEPFFTTKSRGTGLGLSISRAIIRELGGQLEVESSRAGTTMRVDLPPGALPTAEGARPPEPSGVGRLSVLVVDDEPDIGEVIELALERHDVRAVTDGSAALAIIEAEGFPFDLVFCDLMMADVGGMELYEAIAERHPGCEQRVVFVTGGAFTDRTRAFLDVVPNQVMLKPFGLKDIRGVASAVSRGV